MSAGVVSSDRDHEEAAAREHDRDRQEREETLSVVTTSFAAVATAWSAFQAATWSGRQTFALAHAEKLRQLATEARLEGDQQMHLDANLFVAYAGAFAQQNDRYAQFLYDRFPPRLKKAMDAWLATNPRTSKDAPPHPFAMREYEVEAHRRSATLGSEADDALVTGRRANIESDTYVLGTVVFATVILLASLGPRLHRRNARRAMLIVSTAILVAALAWLAVRPIAWVG